MTNYQRGKLLDRVYIPQNPLASNKEKVWVDYRQNSLEIRFYANHEKASQLETSLRELLPTDYAITSAKEDYAITSAKEQEAAVLGKETKITITIPPAEASVAPTEFAAEGKGNIPPRKQLVLNIIDAFLLEHNFQQNSPALFR